MFYRDGRVLFLAVCLTIIASPGAFASAGSLDYSFGTQGLVKSDLGYSDEGAAVAVYKAPSTHAGKIVVAGTVAPVDNAWNKFAVARYLSNGSLDTSFATTGFATITVTGPYDRACAVLIQSDDKVIVVGQADNGNQIGLVRYNANGTLDTGFGTGGIVKRTEGTWYGNWTGAVLQSDGNIAVVGQSWDSSLVVNSTLVRFSSAGAYVGTWKADFVSTYWLDIGGGTMQEFPLYEGFSAVTAQSDGKLVAVGYASTKTVGTNHYTAMTVARFLSNGGLDSSFGSGGKTTISFGTSYSDSAKGVGVQSDGSIVIGGQAASGDGVYDFGLVRLTSAGVLDTTFNSTGKATIHAGGSDNAYAVALQSDGKILIAGTTTAFAVARFNTNGTVDTGFGMNGVVTVGSGGASAMTLQSDGKILLAGSAGGSGLDRDFAMARLNSQSTDMIYGSSTVLQNTDRIAPGTTGDVVRVVVSMNGDLNPLAATSFSCSTAGTTSVSDITSARLYYTGASPAFSTSTPFGSAVTSLGSPFTISSSQALLEGDNYFWLAFAVAPGATVGNVVDAACTSVTIGGTARTPTVTAPAGSRQIYNILAIYDIGSHVPEYMGGTNFVPASSVATGATASNLTAGSGLTKDVFYPDTGLYVYTNWTTSTSPAANQYFEVTLAPGALKQITYQRVTFSLVADYVAASPPYPAYYGPRKVDLRYSTDGFATSNTLLQTLNWTPTDWYEQTLFSEIDISGVGTRTGPITFRWYGYNQDATADPTSSMGFANRTAGPNPTWYTGTGSNLIFKGQVTTTNTPPTLAANTGMTLNQNAAATAITSTMLRVNDAEQGPAALTYTVGTVPAKGTLRKSGSALGASGTFTQDDVNNSRITFTPSGTQNGADSFTFTVSDGSGGTIGSTTFSITITDNVPPTASVSYSPSGPYVKGAVVTITADFSEAVLDGPVMQIAISALTGGSALAATNMSKVTTTRYTYVHTVGDGNGTANVTFSAGTDAAGNVVTATPTSGGSFTVNRTASATAVSTGGTPSVYGNAVTFTATVAAGATGTVAFRDGGLDIAGCAAAALNGSAQATCTTSTLRAGSRSVSAVYAGDNTYAGSTSPAITQTVTSKALTVAGMTASDKPYDGSTAATLVGGALSGVVSPDVVTFSGQTGAFDDKNVGAGKAVTVSGIVLGGADAGNYTVTNPTGLTASITAAPLSVTANDASRTYDRTVYGGGNGVTYGGFAAGDNAGNSLSGTVSYGGTSQGAVKAGSYTIVPSGLTAVGGNYAISYHDGALTISPTALTVSAAGHDKEYDGTVGATVDLSDDRLAGDSLVLSYGSAAFSDPNAGAGKTVTVTGISVGGPDKGNYTSNTTATATKAITKALLTVIAQDAARAFGAPDPAFSAAYSGFVNGEGPSVLSGTPAFTTTATAASPVGSYPITPSTGTLSAANYTFAFVDGTLAVGLASQSITFNPVPAATYGAAPIDLSAFVTGGASGNPVTFSIVSGPGSLGGTNDAIYTITAAGSTVIKAEQAGNASYASATAQQTLVIDGALLVVRADDQTRAFGAANPTLTVSYTGFVGSETAAVLTGTPLVTTPATPSSPVGSYPITPSIGTLSAANYTFEFVEGTLGVGLATQTITFDSLPARRYGDASFTLTASGGASGNPVTFVSSDPAVATVSGTNVTIVGVGTTNIVASEAGDATYASATAEQPLTVHPAVLSGTAENKTRAFGSVNPVFTVAYTGFVGSDSSAVVMGAPTLTTIATSASAPGAYPIVAGFGNLAAANYTFSLVNGTLTVTQAPTTVSIASAPNPSIFGQSVTLTATVTSLGGTPTGNVTFLDGAAVWGTAALDGSGQATLVTATLAGGDHSLSAVYGGDTNFAGSTSTLLTQTVTKAATTTVVSGAAPDPSVVGQAVLVGYSVTATPPGSGTPTGNVTVSDGVNSCTGTVAALSCNLVLTTVGTRTVVATYGGDAGFNGSVSSGLPHTINKADTTAAITSQSPGPSMAGQAVTVVFSVTPNSPGSGTPTGTVTVSDGVINCTASVAAGSCSLTFATAGPRTLTATYVGDARFSGSVSSGAAHTVGKAGTTITITGDVPNPSVPGQPVTVAYTVTANTPGSGTPTGDVTVSDGVNTCTGTVAATSCSVTLTTAGLRTLRATYAGDANFNGSVSADVSHTVNKAGTTTAITSDAPDPSMAGQAVAVAYSVTVVPPGSGTPAGNVTVTDGVSSCTGTVGGGSCSLALTTAGARPLTATYAGDAVFSGSVSSAAPHTVNKAETTTAITSHTSDPSVVGQAVAVSFTVTVAPPGAGTPTGNVTVSDGVNSCVGSVAAGSCSLPLTTAGAHTLSATYAGDTAFNGSVSSNAPHTVGKAGTTAAIVSHTPDPSVMGQAVPVAYTVTVNSPGSGTPTGNVTVSDGVSSCTGTVAAASCALTLTAAGARTLTATYVGDAGFNGCVSSGVPHTVGKAATTSTVASHVPDPSLVGQVVTVSYSVTATPPGSGTATGNVTVSDGVSSCTGTVAAGSCVLTLTTAGARTLAATYAGDVSFNGSVSSAAAHTVGKASTAAAIATHVPNPSVVGEAVTVAYTVAVTPPGSGTPTGNVTVSDGVASCTGTVAAGSCSLALTVVGARTLTATYAGDTNFNGSVSAGSPHAVGQAATTTTIGAHTPNPSGLGRAVVVTYTVAATPPGSGTPTGNVTVTDGVDSCAATAAAGSCALTLTTSGARTLTATYGGDSGFSGSVGTAPHTVLFRYLFAVSKIGSGAVTVSATGVEGNGINCGSDCSETYDEGMVVTPSTAPEPGWRFSGWSGDPDCSDGQVTMDGPRNCVATFVLNTSVTFAASTGNGDITLETSGPGCGFIAAGAWTGALDDSPMYGYPFGLVEFTLNCAAADVTITYPGSIEGTTYRKYGPTTPGDPATATWYPFRDVTVNGSNSLTLHLRDGQLGDDTVTDGRIVDAGGPARQLDMTSIPAMDERGMLLLALLLGAAGLFALRRLSA